MGETRLARDVRLGRATMILGANLPDVDALSLLAGTDFALDFRRGWTHGVLAVLVLPLLLTAALIAFDGWSRGRRRAGPAAPGEADRWRLLWLSYVAVLSHPVAGLAQHLRRASTDALRRSLVLRRRAVHRGPLVVADSGWRTPARPRRSRRGLDRSRCCDQCSGAGRRCHPSRCADRLGRGTAGDRHELVSSLRSACGVRERRGSVLPPPAST